MKAQQLVAGKALRELHLLTEPFTNVLSPVDARWESQQLSHHIFLDSLEDQHKHRHKHKHTTKKTKEEQVATTTTTTLDDDHANDTNQAVAQMLQYECESHLLPPVMTDYFDRIQTETHMIFVVRRLMNDRLKLFDQYYLRFYHDYRLSLRSDVKKLCHQYNEKSLKQQPTSSMTNCHHFPLSQWQRVLLLGKYVVTRQVGSDRGAVADVDDTTMDDIDVQKAYMLDMLNQLIDADMSSGEKDHENDSGGEESEGKKQRQNIESHDALYSSMKKVLLLRLGLIYFNEKDYEHCLLMFGHFLELAQSQQMDSDMWMIEQQLVLWLNVVIALLHRHNLSFQNAFQHFQSALSNRLLVQQLFPLDRSWAFSTEHTHRTLETNSQRTHHSVQLLNSAVNEQRRDFSQHVARCMQLLRSALWYWMGIVCEDLQYVLWAAQCYQHCLHFIMYESAIASNEHPFVNLAVIYLRIAENYQKMRSGRERSDGMPNVDDDTILQLYQRAFDMYAVENPNLLIQISTFRVQYQRAVIAIRIAKLLYVRQQFNQSLIFLKWAEKLFLQIKYIETQGEGSEYTITDYLHNLHRTLAIASCRCGDVNEASRYVKLPKTQTTDDHQQTTAAGTEGPTTTSLTYEQQLAQAREMKRRGQVEKRSYARSVVEQHHPTLYLSMFMIAAIKGDELLVQYISDIMLSPSNEGLFNAMPVIIWQRIISRAILSNNFKLAQLLMSKCLLFHHAYVLGWYVLLLLSVLLLSDSNDDRGDGNTGFAVGSYRQLMQLCPNSNDMNIFWTSALREIGLLSRTDQPHRVSKL